MSINVERSIDRITWLMFGFSIGAAAAVAFHLVFQCRAIVI